MGVYNCSPENLGLYSVFFSLLIIVIVLLLIPLKTPVFILLAGLKGALVLVTSSFKRSILEKRKDFEMQLP